MAEEVPEAAPREIPCNIAAASAIIPASVLLDRLFRELISARRSLVRTLEQVDRVLDEVREEKLKQ